MLLAGNPISGFGYLGVVPGFSPITAAFAPPVAPTIAPTLAPTPAATTHETTAVLAQGVCSNDGQFVWDIGADGTGSWRRLKVGESCTVYWTGGAPNVCDQTAGCVGGGVSVTASAAPGPIKVAWDTGDTNVASDNPDDANKSLQVGPFTIPLGVKAFNINWSGLLPDDWRKFIDAELSHDCSNCISSSMIDAPDRLRAFLGSELPTKINQDLVKLPEVQVKKDMYGTLVPTLKIELPDQPIAVVTRPDTNDEWGMYMIVVPRDPTYPWDAKTNPYQLMLLWRPKPQGIWDWIKRIVGKVISAIEHALCQLQPTAISTPNPYAQAGALVLQMTGECTPSCPAGMSWEAAIKSCVCPPGQTYDQTKKSCVPITPMPATSPWYTQWYVIAGAAVALGLLLTMKPKTAKAAP